MSLVDRILEIPEVNPRRIVLPYPPSLNTYWRRVGSKVLISEKGREYTRSVALILITRNVKRLIGHLGVAIKAYMPDKRQRDVDNIQKVPIDAMEKAGLYDNDNQIKFIAVEASGVKRPRGEIIVYIWELEPERLE